MFVFTLTMPNNNSWNGKFSGRDNVYARQFTDSYVNNILKKNNIENIHGKSFVYNFGDGWTAMISVEKMTCNESRKIMSKSVGFMSYDWMIKSIMEKGKISS